MLTGENGILTQANNSKIEQSHGAVKEAISLAYNEWQIKINTADTTKLASTETVTIKGEEEKALVGTSTTFLQFLNREGYIKEGTTDVLDVEALTGSKQALGNGTDNDIYKIEEKDGSYVVSYYDVNGTPKEIWSIANSTETGSAELEPDTGKEALILVYNVSAGDTIELPYYLKWVDGNYNQYDATYNFTVDWGDGNKTEGITNTNIAGNSTHQYTEAGEKRITITGTFESIAPYRDTPGDIAGIDKLVRIEQWGTTGLKTIGLFDCTNLTQIAQPTENSFKDLSYVSFETSGIKSIPDKMFLNCTKITSFAWCFRECYNLTTIGEGVFDGCDNVTSYYRTFYYCINLTGKAPELWLTGTNSKENGYKGNPDGENCFNECEKLDNYEEIPEYWCNYVF